MKDVKQPFSWITKKDIILLKDSQPQLSYDSQKDIISGYLCFEASSSKERIEDKYKIKIDFSQADPLPLVKEVGGRIEEIAKKKNIQKLEDLHVNNINKGLCLCSRFEAFEYFEKFKISDSPCHTFIKDLVIPFFYGLSFFEKFNRYPFGELEHGLIGLISEIKKHPLTLLKYKEQYQKFHPEEFKKLIKCYLESDVLLKKLINKEYKKVGRNEPCPCQSKLKYKKCHLLLIDLY